MKNNKKTSLGIGENIEGLLCYAVVFITGIVFLALEKDNKFIRFHAMQSLAIFLPLWVIATVIGWIPIVGWLILTLITPLILILWLFLMFKAFKGERFKLPVVGDFAEKQIGK